MFICTAIKIFTAINIFSQGLVGTCTSFKGEEGQVDASRDLLCLYYIQMCKNKSFQAPLMPEPYHIFTVFFFCVLYSYRSTKLYSKIVPVEVKILGSTKLYFIIAPIEVKYKHIYVLLLNCPYRSKNVIEYKIIQQHINRYCSCN